MNAATGFFVAALLLPAAAVPDGARGVRVRPPPAWVDVAPLDPALPIDPGEVQGGKAYLLLDSQEWRAAGPVGRYERRAWRVVNEQGVEGGAHLTIDFDPSYEQLTVHEAVVHRDGKAQTRLSLGAIEVLQRESSLERRLYDGTHSALVFLEDVRVGDVVDTSWTIVGSNPALGGRFGYDSQFAWAAPVGRSRLRLLVASRDEVAWRLRGTTQEPTIAAVDGHVEITWDEIDIKAIAVDSERPWWHEPFPAVQVATRASWADVARWGRSLFDPGLVPTPEVKAIAAQLAAETPGSEERALDALRFVQDDVRYLGLEFGPGAYQPASGDRVLKRRFGDCKDKAVLLVTLLRELGLEAHPALVSTTEGHHLTEALPSHALFDHAVVVARIDGHDFWLDGTWLGQGGTLRTLHVPRWEQALVLAPDTRGLTPVKDRGWGDVSLDERIDARKEPATAVLTTTYTGRRADLTRGDLARSRRPELDRSYRDWYEAQFDGALTVGHVVVEDDRTANVLKTVETYEVPELWRPVPGSTRRETDLLALGIREGLVRPDRVQRTMPLAIVNPHRLQQHTVLLTDIDLSIEPSRDVVPSPAFRHERHVSWHARKRELVIDHSFESLVDHLDPKEVPAHAKDVDRAWALLTFGLWREPATPEPSPDEGPGLNWPLLALGLTALALGGACATAHEVWPRTPVTAPHLHGWIVVLLPLLAILPAALAGRLAAWSMHWGQAAWLERTVVGGAMFAPAWAPLLCLEVVHATGLLAWAVAVLVTFVRRRATFPRLLAGLFAAEGLLLAVESQVASGIPGQDPLVLWRGSLALVMLAVAMLIRIVLASSRLARVTFVK